MLLVGSRRCGGPVLALARALGLMLMGVAVQAGEPIQFSTPAPQNSVPTARPKEPPADKGLRAFKSDSEGPVFDLPVTSQSEAVPSKRRMQEFWDKRDREKNWIFVSPSDFGDVKHSADTMFDVESPEESSRLIKGSKVMERFWQAQDTKDRPNAKTPGDDPQSKRDPSEPASGSGSLVGQGSREAREKAPLDWGLLFEQRAAGDFLKSSTKDSLDGLFDQTGRSFWLFSDDTTLSDRSRSRPDNRKENLGDFQKLLRGQPLPPGLSGTSDPLNTAVDSTRQPINPVISRVLQDPTEAFQMQNPLGGLPTAGFGSGVNPVSSFADFSGSGLNPAARSPSMFAPAEPAGVTPKPATFDFPKRKF